MNDQPKKSGLPTKNLGIATKVLFGFAILAFMGGSLSFFIFHSGLQVLFFFSPLNLLFQIGCGIVFLASVFCGIKLFRPQSKMVLVRQGFKPLMIAALICLLFLIPVEIYQWNRPLKVRHMDSYSKSDLHAVYLACKSYWDDKGSDKNCDLKIASQGEYGFVQSEYVNINGKGTAKNFTATAYHQASDDAFTIDAIGNIRKK
jgi:hypothetical protein